MAHSMIEKEGRNVAIRQLLTGTLTLLFTDIEGSTRLLQQLGDAYATVLKECRSLMREAFRQSRGFEVDTQGDAFFVVFERASDAVSAAIHVQQALFATQWPEGADVRVRIGIHTGEPLPTEEGYIGLDVHRAARIMSAAHGGQVLLSQMTRDSVASELPERVSLRNLGAYRLKDITGVHQLYQLVIPALPADFPPLATLSSQHLLRNVPTPSTSFVGREEDITLICTQLQRADIRLLTLLGPGGVGKTRLALQVASQLSSQFVDGMCFVPLDQVSSAESVVSALAQALNLTEEKDLSLFDQVKATLRTQSLLLILDNFEQVMVARRVIADLLASCSKLKILVTSRVLLHMQAEHVFEVSPLSLPERRQQGQQGQQGQLPDPMTLSRYTAIALFVQRAQAVQPNFQLTTTNATVVVDICRRLDGIPLAIELAAARVRHFQPVALLTRLEKGLTVLQGRAEDVPARQQTLRGAIAWSYDLLSSTQQRVFRRLSVCVNGATMEAAEQICADISDTSDTTDTMDEDIAEILVALVDQSMLQRHEVNKDEVRFWQLQTLREYGLACLVEAGELEATRASHAAYYLSWLEGVAPRLAGAEQADWLDRLDQEYENVKSALDWLLEHASGAVERSVQALRLCIALLGFWELRCYFNEGLAYLKRALSESQGIAPSERAQALHGAAFLALMQEDNAQAEVFLRESQLLFRESGDRAGMANILRLQGSLALVKCNFKLARRLLEEALTLYRGRSDTQRVISTCNALAQIAMSQCDYDRAESLLEENIALNQAQGGHHRAAYSCYLLAYTLFLSRGDLAQAKALAEESMALFKAVGDKRLLAYAFNLRGRILLFEEYADSKAKVLLEEGLVIFKTLGDRSGTVEALFALAEVAAFQGEYEAARRYYEESWHLLRTFEAKELWAACLEGFGEVLVKLDATQLAVQLWGTAATVRATIMAPVPPIYRSAYVQAVSLAREQLGEATFQAAWTEGHSLPLEQVELPQNLRRVAPTENLNSLKDYQT